MPAERSKNNSPRAWRLVFDVNTAASTATRRVTVYSREDAFRLRDLLLQCHVALGGKVRVIALRTPDTEPVVPPFLRDKTPEERRVLVDAFNGYRPEKEETAADEAAALVTRDESEPRAGSTEETGS